MTITVPELVLWIVAQPEPSTVTLLTLMNNWDEVRYVPQGKRSMLPLKTAAIALLMADVSSVFPLPVAPKAVTLIKPVPVPEPLRATAVGELEALLTTMTPPVTLPATAGANVTFSVAD